MNLLDRTEVQSDSQALECNNMKITVKGYVYQWNASAAFAETGECVYDLSDFPSRSYEKHMTHLFQELKLPHEAGRNTFNER